MNHAEYWFLDAAIRLKIPFNWLSASNVDEMLNRPHHHLSAPELLVILQRMFERGDLFLEYSDRYQQHYRTQAPSRSEIESTLYLTHDEWMTRPEQAFYGVTILGGTKWETLSHPQWDRFYDEGYGIDPYEGEITAPDRGLVEQVLALAPYASFITAIVPESIRWSVLQPWEATYWKQLPIGYRVDFTYLPRSEDEELAHPAAPDWVHARYQHIRRWYTNYLEPEQV
jgi:hypothetical protein